ncbi:FAD-dependent oxidoreductase [Ornithinibacter aureus]|uniref:FAD-dependent oxidoreductase n=1 Tax=Ornithinibacter aureus TaxID=622664 RepID=A0ABP8JDR1_9MICO|nr:response regulator [Ornithinibacter aureus]KAF0833976.1 thioredoxin reductase (NADPH) [Ornithinibacter aureus]
MARATILAVDDDPQVARAIVRDLQARYGSEYRVVRATSGDEALGVLAELTLRGRPVALLVSDQRMPGMTGIELMARVRETSPDTRLLLLTAYSDTDVAIRAINDIGLTYYMVKRWEPPDSALYPVVDDLLSAWRADHPDTSSAIRVVGHLWSDRSYDVKMFLARNHIPYTWLDLERDEEARLLLDLADVDTADLPLVLLPEGQSLRSPTSVELAEALGLRTRAQQPLYDLCIVGGGPAGLAAAVYAASEGLRTVVVERDAPGGQAGQSAAIENYLGFPKGVSGAELTHRAVAQAARFGAETVLAQDVVGLGSRGVYYGASASEAAQTAGQVVHVVGAANSAGQAVLNFAKVADKVVMLVRGTSLEASMSEYLIARISAADNVEVRFRTEVSAAHGTEHLESVTLVDRDTGAQHDEATNWLFVFIGALPRTDWLGDAVLRDALGFLVTALTSSGRCTPRPGRWPGPPTPSRRACPGCSPPVTSGSTP